MTIRHVWETSDDCPFMLGKKKWTRHAAFTPLFLRDRNYGFFAVLADVRNYGHVEQFIAANRGHPENATTRIYQRKYNEWEDYSNEDYHSHSWVGLKELLDWPWDSPAGYDTGLVDIKAFKALQEKGTRPDAWCQASYGPGVVVAERAEDITDKTTLVRARWNLTYREFVGKWMLEELFTLPQRFDPKLTRFIFCFDN